MAAPGKANEPQTLQVPFTGGMDQATAPEFVNPEAKVVGVINGIWHHEGGVEKRLGVTFQPQTQLPGDPAMHAPMRLLSRGSEVAHIDGDSLFDWVPEAGVWASRGLISAPLATRQRVYSSSEATANNISLLAFSTDEANGLIALVWQDTAGGTIGNFVSGNIWATVYSASTGAPVFSSYQVSASSIFSQPICMFVGSKLVITAIQSGAYVAIFALNTSTWAWSGPVTIAGPLTLTGYDATICTGVASQIAVIWGAQTGSGGTGFANLNYATVSIPSNTVTHSGTLTSYVGSGNYVQAPMCCRFDANFGTFWIAYQVQLGNTTNYSINTTCLNASTFANLLAPTVVTSPGHSNTYPEFSLGCEILDSTHVLIASTGGGVAAFAISGNPSAYAIISTLGTTLTSTPQLAQCKFFSRPFRATTNGVTRCYALVALQQAQTGSSTSYVGSIYLLDLQAYEAINGAASVTPRAVATIAPRQANLLTTSTGAPSNANPPYPSQTGNASASQYRIPVLIQPTEEFGPETVVLATTIPTSLVDIATLDFTGATNWASAEGNSEAIIAGGLPRFYDGVSAPELGFLAWPIATLAGSASGGNQSNGAYGYAFVYSQIDAAGQIHRSIAFPATITLSGGTSAQSVTCTIATTPFSDRLSAGRQIVCEVYRTTINSASGVYYYAGSVHAPASPGTGTVTFTDTLSDAQIQNNATLYTTGGVLDSVCPPSFRHVVRHNDRFWGIDDTGYVIWFTTALNGADAPYFNEGLTIQFEDGPLTALATMDQNLVVFSQRRIWVIGGDGPAITGVGSDLTNPVTVMTDVGPGDWRSVVSTPVGIFFQAASNGGIYLLGRDLQVTFIGKPAQNTLGTYAALFIGATETVVQATLCPQSGQVRFVTSIGLVVYYDYVLQRWGTLSYFDPPTCALTIPATGQWYYGAASGYVYTENTPTSPSAWYDTTNSGKQWVRTTITCGTIRGSGLQSWLAWGPVQGYATWLDAADLTVTLQFDNAQSGGQAHTFAHSTLVAANNVAAQWAMQPRAANSMGQALQVILSDAKPADATDTTGQGVRWLGFSVDVTLIGGRNLNLAPGQKA